MNLKCFAFALVFSLASFNVFAQNALSTACEWASSSGSPFSMGTGYFTGDFQFYAGETLSVAVTTPVTGSPTQVELIFGFATPGFTVVDSTTIPGIMRHTFTSDEIVRNLGFIVTPSGEVTVKLDCRKPTPIPTLNWQGIAVLVTLLAGFAYYRRRRVA